MKLIFPKVWFATERLMSNQARFFNFSDRGPLSFDSGILQFSSRRQSLRIKSIEKIDLIYPRMPWISLAYSALACMILFGLILSKVPSEFITIAISVFVPFFFLLLPVMVFIQKAMLWVEVAFIDDGNVLRHAYFMDGSRWHLNVVGSMLEDTLKMYKELKSIQRSAG